jgi:Brp/Blh family beta-carotene 15,15'-monooxygenase
MKRMKSTILLFTCLALAFYLFDAFFKLSIESQFIVALPWIVVFGISHGAVDHILYKQSSTLTLAQFYGVYIGLMGIYAALWYVSPKMALMSFLLLSAFHFGQSQWGGYTSVPVRLRNLLAFVWGGFVLSVLFVPHKQDLQEIAATAGDLDFLELLYDHSLRNLALIFGVATGILALTFLGKGWISLNQFLLESVMLLLVLVAFVYLPLLLGFVAYFAIVHSFRMLEEEYDLLLRAGFISSFSGFLSAIFPLTVLSIFGGLVLVGLIQWEVISISVSFLLIVLISLITFPHSIVMHGLYKKNLISTDT